MSSPGGLLYTPEQAVARVREAHEKYIGDGTRQPSQDDLVCYAAVVWAVLDFTERPKHTTLIKA